MRRILWAGLVACHGATPTVEIATPTTSATALPIVAEEEPMPPSAVRIASRSGGAWALSFAKEPGFRVYQVGEVGRALLTWRMGHAHALKALAEDEDYPANHVEPIDLVIHTRGVETVVSLGELSGWAAPRSQSYCKGRGFRVTGDGQDGAWGFASEASIASAFSVGITQGSSDFLVVRDGDTLHLLHRETSDGKCDEIKQGPLETCEGFEWGRRAEIHIGGGTDLFERIEDDGKTLDCAEDRSGEHLTPP